MFNMLKEDWKVSFHHTISDITSVTRLNFLIAIRPVLVNLKRLLFISFISLFQMVPFLKYLSKNFLMEVILSQFSSISIGRLLSVLQDPLFSFMA